MSWPKRIDTSHLTRFKIGCAIFDRFDVSHADRRVPIRSPDENSHNMLEKTSLILPIGPHDRGSCCWSDDHVCLVGDLDPTQQSPLSEQSGYQWVGLLCHREHRPAVYLALTELLEEVCEVGQQLALGVWISFLHVHVLLLQRVSLAWNVDHPGLLHGHWCHKCLDNSRHRYDV